MSSTFLGLNTAYTGLQASNAALNTTANNIANVETKGYSRQQVTTQAADAIRSFTTYGCVGAGVDTLAIERIRDNFYDQKYWSNQSNLGLYEVKQYYMNCLEEYYKDDKTVKGFTTIFNEYSDSLEELAKNPDDTKFRQQMIGQAGNLTNYFSDMYTNLQKLQDDVNQEIKVNVDRINSIAEEIASLNKQINVIEMNSGLVANELRDQRDLLVDELAELVDVETEEQDVLDMNNLDRHTGGSRYMVKICGQPLVDGNSYHTMTCVTKEANVKTNQTDISGLYEIYFSGYESDWTADDYRKKGDALNINSEHSGGKLAGLIQMRDGNNGENFAGRVKKVETDADDNRNVTVEVSADYLKDLNKLNLSMDGGIINIASRNLYFTSWSYEYTEGSDTASFTFVLDDSRNQSLSGGLIPVEIFSDADQTKTNASVGQAISYQGIPYYLSQMNEWVRLYSTAANNVLQSGTLDDGSAGHNLYTGEHRTEARELRLAKSDRLLDAAGDFYDITDKTGVTTKMDKYGHQTRSVGMDTELQDADGTKWRVTAVDSTTGAAELTKLKDDGTLDTSTVRSGVTLSDAYTKQNTDPADFTPDSYYLLTAGSFKVAEELTIDADLLATRYEAKNVSDGVEKNDIVKQLIRLRSDDTMMSFRGCSADQYLVTVLGDVALNSQRARTFTDNYTYMQKTIGNQRLSISGVDNDEEAVNLTKFQQQYNMASKMIQTLTEVYDRLILQTGV
ncbi:MAG: flagellar hook-associated protein FlgK [Lachnospiraceae bacterium]|nr:flagellar hook-associated protein FlgK [Lachnospiraceae bacterium]